MEAVTGIDRYASPYGGQEFAANGESQTVAWNLAAVQPCERLEYGLAILTGNSGSGIFEADSSRFCAIGDVSDFYSNG